jgi:hypothetical protein
MTTPVQESIRQAIGIVLEKTVDLWLTYVTETVAGDELRVPMIYGHDLTWDSALILTRSGERIAIVGRLEAATPECTGAYPTVISYDESIRPCLLETVEQLDSDTDGPSTRLKDCLPSIGSHR